jgi:DNA helicase-2/ATP-dependent DNA helicase PcrA
VTIAAPILKMFGAMNTAQRDIVANIEGPLLVIAGPGSGKTFSLVLRTLNLLLLKKAEPKDLVICTFTEKAAFELRDRISAAARKVGYAGDLTELRVSTIHALCHRLLALHRHRTVLGNNFETLDELTQLLFIFDNFDEIIGPDTGGTYLTQWTTKWSAIEGAKNYFDKITEELIDPGKIVLSTDPFVSAIGGAYERYVKTLLGKNRLDFSHQQKLVFELLSDPAVGDSVSNGVKYLMVDEYQDTNYIQEQLLLRLSSQSKNICVVGDEDQSLYRFRGATVRNILEFPQRVSGCQTINLTTNYRSHRQIVAAYDRWMASATWTVKGRQFRFNKTIEPDPNGQHPAYPSIFCVWGQDARDEAERFADLVQFLKRENVIEDYSQVALLLHSVRLDHSGPFIDALDKKGIPAFCPRARAYFENEEVRLMVACLALIFGYHGEGRGQISGSLVDLAQYLDECILDLGRRFGGSQPIAKLLQQFVRQIQQLQKEETLDMRPADYFFRLLSVPPFDAFLSNENRARNLAILSQLINTFQNYYHYTVVTFKNREYLRFHLFGSFIRLLYDGGINEYEDPDQPFPKGHVQIMTIHQSKGLEFPVVVVGSLDKQLSTQKKVDRDLQQFYHRPLFEPESRITEFDRMRLHYVAFSRPEKILVLTAHAQPKPHFIPIWQGLPQWPYVQSDLLAAQSFTLRDRIPIKRAYSFTGDLKLYETCPRQYQYFREYDFTPSRSAVIFFGLLVHQTIEEIHRLVLDGELSKLKEPRIRELFERTFTFLAMADVRPIGDAAKESAFRQVMNYFRQNQKELKQIVETEVDVSVEKDGYILTGKIDLLMGSDGRLELLDFKTSPRPVDSPELLRRYEQQLCTYAHILERRHGKRVERLVLYWTAEDNKANAIMEFPYRLEMVQEAGQHFDDVVTKIEAKDFKILKPPESGICKECDLRPYCLAKGTIR